MPAPKSCGIATRIRTVAEELLLEAVPCILYCFPTVSPARVVALPNVVPLSAVDLNLFDTTEIVETFLGSYQPVASLKELLVTNSSPYTTLSKYVPVEERVKSINSLNVLIVRSHCCF